MYLLRSQVSQHQRLASFACKTNDRTPGQFSGRHLPAAADKPLALVDDALREGYRDRAGGVASAERVGTARIWIVEAIDPSRPVRLGGRVSAQGVLSKSGQSGKCRKWRHQAPPTRLVQRTDDAGGDLPQAAAAGRPGGLVSLLQGHRRGPAVHGYPALARSNPNSNSLRMYTGSNFSSGCSLKLAGM